MNKTDVASLRRLTQVMLDRYADSEAVIRMARETLYAAMVALSQRVELIEDAMAATQEAPMTFDKLCEDHSTADGSMPV